MSRRKCLIRDLFLTAVLFPVRHPQKLYWMLCGYYEQYNVRVVAVDSADRWSSVRSRGEG